MTFTNAVEQKKLEQVNTFTSLNQFKRTVVQLLQLNRVGLLDDDDALLLINGYVKMYEEARDAGDRGRQGTGDKVGRSRY